MVKWPVLPLLLCVVVLSGCTTTVRNPSSLAATQTSTRTETSQTTAAPAPRSHPATNRIAPPRLANQILSGNKKTSTYQERSTFAHHTGTPRLAGTVVHASQGNGSRKAVISTLTTASESSDELMVSGQIPGQPAAMDSAAVAQTTESPFKTDDIAALIDFHVLAGVFAILAVSALGIWGGVRFIGYWKSLNPSSWSAGGG